MNKATFELNLSGLRELMKSGGMQDALREAGNAVASRGASMSGEAYGVRVYLHSYTANCNVYPDSDEARDENYANNTVLKALSSSGLPMSK